MPFSQFTSKMLQNAYPGLSSQDDPNNPMNQLRGLASQPAMVAPAPPPAQQPTQSPEQALNGGDAPQMPTDPNAQLQAALLSQSAIPEEQMRPIQENIAASKEGLQKFLDYQNALKSAPVQTDLSPTMAFADYITGGKSNLAGSYAKPQSGEDRVGQLAKLQGMSQDEREKITNSLVKLATGKSAQNQLRAMGQAANLDFRQRATAQKQYDSGVLPMKQSLDASSRFNSLLKNSMGADGTIKATPQLIRTLGIEQAKLVSGKNNFGEGTSEGLMIDSYATKAGGLLQKLKDAPQGVLSKENAAQLAGESDILARDYQTQIDSLADQLKAGATPIQLGVLNQRHKALQDTYKKRFGYWGGEPKKGDVPLGVDPKDWSAASEAQKKEFLEHMNGK